MISQNKKAISEVNAILKQLNRDSLNKIPKQIIQEFEKNATENTDYIKPNIPLEELNLQEETKEILAVICYTYFCDETERKQWNQELAENERKYQQELQQKYDPNNIFNKTENQPVVGADDPVRPTPSNLTEYKEPFFQKIWNKIKELFHLK